MGRRVDVTRKISSDRVGIKRNQKNKIIMAVEGANKTEKIYFNNYRTGKENYTITFANGNDTDPIRLVKRLAKQIKRMGLDLENGDKAYCIFDVDIDPNKDIAINEAKEIAKNEGIEIITSSPCIELWFLLHYEYTTGYMTNDNVIRRLKNHYEKYEKTSNIFAQINDKVKTAIKYAKKLEKYNIDNNKIIGSVEANPNTEIYKIIEYLLKNK